MDGTLQTIVDRLDRLLSQSAVTPRFFGVKTAASYAGLSEDSIRRMIERGDLAAYRPVRGKVLLDRHQLDAVILGSTRRPRRGRGIRCVDAGQAGTE